MKTIDTAQALLDAENLVKEARIETRASIIESLLMWQRANLAKLTMARIRLIVETKGESVDPHEWVQLQLVIGEWKAQKRRWLT